eukprot:5463373-Amphidinium_carterae.1
MGIQRFLETLASDCKPNQQAQGIKSECASANHLCHSKTQRLSSHFGKFLCSSTPLSTITAQIEFKSAGTTTGF